MSKAKPLLCLGFLILGLVLLVIYFKARSPRLNCERFLRRLRAVEVGATTLEDFTKGLALAGVTDLSSNCQQQVCGVGLLTENKLLHKLGVSPPTIVDASVEFKNGVASEIYIALIVSKKNEQGEWHDDRGVVVRETTDHQLACSPDFRVTVKQRYGVGDRYWAAVAMDPCVLNTNRLRTMTVNTGCLTKIGGCKKLGSMLPQILGGQ